LLVVLDPQALRHTHRTNVMEVPTGRNRSEYRVFSILIIDVI